MFKALRRGFERGFNGKGAGIAFPNTSRSYNAEKRCIRFGGYDAVFEVQFDLDAAVLDILEPGGGRDERGRLRSFDAHRPRIEKVAGAVYARRRSPFVELFAADF